MTSKNLILVGKFHKSIYIPYILYLIAGGFSIAGCHLKMGGASIMRSQSKTKGTIEKCNTLFLLSDSLKFAENFMDTNKTQAAIKARRFYTIISGLFNEAKIEPYWNCSFDLCTYNNFNLHKSLYKLDILRLMRFYACKDSVRLQSSTAGQFSDLDKKLMEKIRVYKDVDTTILYGK